MQAISLWLAAAIVILTGWAIVKKYQVNMVLFIAGLLLNIIGVMNGATNFLPKNSCFRRFCSVHERRRCFRPFRYGLR